MKIHDLKTWPIFFQAVWEGKKRFEVRKNDREFGMGDELHLLEYDPMLKIYTGRYVTATVYYICKLYGLDSDYVGMGITIKEHGGDDNIPFSIQKGN
jgi:hypothetical protein